MLFTTGKCEKREKRGKRYTYFALTLFAALEPRVSGHELLQDRVQLVLGAHAQLQGVHERDEALRVRDGSEL